MHLLRSCRDHITPVLRHLHWLPVRQRIKFKLAMTVYKCLHGLAPTYSADDCLAISAIAGKRHLRSTRTGLLSVPRTSTMLGTRSLTVAGSVIWNSLPTALLTATLAPLTFAPPVWLIDSASADYLWRAIQIHSSSSSSSSSSNVWVNFMSSAYNQTSDTAYLWLGAALGRLED